MQVFFCNFFKGKKNECGISGSRSLTTPSQSSFGSSGISGSRSLMASCESSLGKSQSSLNEEAMSGMPNGLLVGLLGEKDKHGFANNKRSCFKNGACQFSSLMLDQLQKIIILAIISIISNGAKEPFKSLIFPAIAFVFSIVHAVESLRPNMSRCFASLLSMIVGGIVGGVAYYLRKTEGSLNSKFVLDINGTEWDFNFDEYDLAAALVVPASMLFATAAKHCKANDRNTAICGPCCN